MSSCKHVDQSDVPFLSKLLSSKERSKSPDDVADTDSGNNSNSVNQDSSGQVSSVLFRAFSKEKSHPSEKESAPHQTKRMTFMERLCNFAEDVAASPHNISEEIKENFRYLIELGEGIHKYAQDETDGYPDRTQLLEECEQEILKEADSNLKPKFHKVLVDKQPDSTDVIIHSVCYEPLDVENLTNFPLVLIHGYAGGLACFHRNFSSLCESRKVYAIDLPGFALSSRVEFKDEEPENCRNQMADLIEKWRLEMVKEDTGLNNFIILGHSFGGYIAATYAVKYKEHVRHLILADPWGVLSREEEEEEEMKLSSEIKKVAITGLAIANKLLKEPILSLQGIRDLGEAGSFFFVFLIPSDYGPKMIAYIYLANKQEPATGEELFTKVSESCIWPRVSLRRSLTELANSVPVSFLYGNKSPYHQGGSVVQCESIKNVYLDKQLNAGHHIQVEDPETFNIKVKEICNRVDKNEDLQ